MSYAWKFLVVFLVAFAVAGAGAAGAYHTQWVAQNCNYNAPTPTSYITRDGSITVALYARNEGYQWAGGCWNDNDVDDSPGDRKENGGTGGEGADCSGFTFKVWRETEDKSRCGFHQWWRLRYIHGPIWPKLHGRRWRAQLSLVQVGPRSKWTPLQATTT